MADDALNLASASAVNVGVDKPTCCHGIDDVCVAAGCLLGIPGGERGDDLCDLEGCSCHDQ